MVEIRHKGRAVKSPRKSDTTWKSAVRQVVKRVLRREVEQGDEEIRNVVGYVDT